ncbi:uncharacterized protein LOC109924736 isoform X2 [Rhincodon typus]|uniref:uncharacterized protein LOC109924736 isoform X2 n=1 Tax=Rhincodon typus TaxID=259920 RepID=UPI00202DF6AD|nr:uncharacterized protein LOC109924736 isoform X2 [Rhincodon typus]
MEDGEMGQNHVQDVCQKFQVLEDRTVAHVLQEEEIEQHLCANKLRSHRVRLNLQVAKRLQEEEDERSRQLRRQLHNESMESDYPRIIQEERQRTEASKHRRLQRAQENSGRLRRSERGRGGHIEDREDQKEPAMGRHDSPDDWNLPVRREFSQHGGQPRSRKPLVWSELEVGAGWYQSVADGDEGLEREAGERDHDESPRKLPFTERLGSGPSLKWTLGHVGQASQALSEDAPGARPLPTDGLHGAARDRERAGRRREYRSELSYTEGSERRAPKPARSRAKEGSDPSGAFLGSHPSEGPDLTRRSASDSESHTKRRKRNRLPESRARSEVSHRPIWAQHRDQGLSEPQAWDRRRQDPIRHQPRSQGNARPLDPPRDPHGHLDIKPTANHLHPPLDPKERPEREGRLKEANKHQSLAVEDRKKQNHRPFVAGDQQTHQPLAVSQKLAPHPLAIGESPTHYPPRTKGKVKQVHFLLDAEERVKPVHWPGANNQKPVQRPVDLKRKEAHWPIASKQKHAQPPLAVEEKGKHAQIPLAVKERKLPLHSMLAKKNHLHYRLGNKEADAIIDYVLDKRKGKDPISLRHLSQSPPASQGNQSLETDRGDLVGISSNSRRILSSPLVGDPREDRTAPAGLGAQEDTTSSKALSPHLADTHQRDEPAPRATNGREAKSCPLQLQARKVRGERLMENVTDRKLPRSQRQESHWIRDHEDGARKRLGRNRAGRSPTAASSNRHGNRLHAEGCEELTTLGCVSGVTCRADMWQIPILKGA